MVPTGLFYTVLEGIFDTFVFAPHSNSLVCPFPPHYRSHSRSRLANLEDGFLLENLTGLQSLEVIRINILDTSYYSGPSWLKQLLQSIPSGADLRHIKLKVMIDRDSTIPRDTWAAVESTFDGDAFPVLMKVEINPEPDRYLQCRSEVHDTVRRIFPRLEERKILSVSFDPWSRCGPLR